jgi:acyl-coenzyme A synthetase/AMP-(fatty) acid ligase
MMLYGTHSASNKLKRSTNISARTLIASYKKPRSIDFVDSLPRLFNGKIDKKALLAPYWQGRERQIS